MTATHPTLPAGRPGEGSTPAKRSRAGRNLGAAIAVGLALGLALVLTLNLFRPAFVALVAVAIAVGARELVRGLRTGGLHPPLLPLVAGAGITAAISYPEGRVAAVLAALVTAAVAIAWRLIQRRAYPETGLVSDLAACAFVAIYVGYLASFATLLAAPSDGPRRVTAFIVTAVCSDVGGYASGVLSGGRHKLAPTVSPGKSVEGLIGGTVFCIASGLIFLGPVLHSGHPWYGVVFGLAIVTTATLGDLAESALKRDIGIKDMGTLLPGHGGILDRIDSLLLSAPVAWILLSLML